MAAWDWGTLINTGIDILQGQQIGGGQVLYNDPYSGQFGNGGTGYIPPTELGGDNGIPVRFKKCRRRRRRLLTEGDFNDLMRIATLPNKQNVAVALAKAVGRR